MKVAELIEKLKKFDPGLTVYIEDGESAIFCQDIGNIFIDGDDQDGQYVVLAGERRKTECPEFDICIECDYQHDGWCWNQKVCKSEDEAEATVRSQYGDPVGF